MTNKLKFCTQTAVAALLIGVSAGAAQAQAASDQMETVVVTGTRESLASALELKKNSNLIIESVTAEDVGKMPDQDVAESLQRLPGVQIDRDQGKGTAVLIDGLRQNLTTLNGDVFLTGKEFYVEGEAANGGGGANVQYNSLSGIPSEEIGRVDIYKSPNAGLTEGGMGGIIDLRTRDPLTSKDGFSFVVNLRGTSTSYSSTSSITPDASIIASYKPSSTFAITGSVSYDNENTHTHEYESYNRSPWDLTTDDVKGYNGVGPLLPCSGTPLVCPSGQGNLSTRYIMPEYAYFSDVYDENRTIGATLGATWAPSASITTSINWFYSHTGDQNITYSNKVGLNGGQSTSGVPGTGAPGIDADAPYTIDANGVVQSATFYVQGAEGATLYQDTHTEANNFQWHTKWDDGGPLTGTLDVSFSRASSNLQADQEDVEHGYYGADGASGSIQPTAPGCNNFGESCATGNPPIQVQWTNGGSSGLPTATYTGAYANVLSNPAYTLFKSAWAWANLGKQEEDAIRGELVDKPSFLAGVDGSITGGFRIAQRDVWQNFGRYLINGLDVNGNYINNCCYAGGNGGWLYYQDPGYAAIPYSTATSNPSLALTTKSFAFGNMIVKNPVTGGMNNPATFLNTIWNNASVVPTMTPSAIVTPTGVVACTTVPAPAACAVPAKTATPNNSEKLFVDTLSSFKVHETTESAYLMSDMGSKDKGFHANFGVRVVLTSQTVDGATSAPTVYSYGTATWNGVNSNNVPFSQGKYTVDILPSMNVSLFITDDQIVRFAAARVVSPADLFNLGVGQYYNFTRVTGGAVNVNPGSPSFGKKDGFAFANGSSGNPQLDPYRANQFNLSWEDYFAPGGLASVGGFYKQIESFEVQEPVNTFVMDDFGGSTGPVTEPINGGKGSIYGLEFAGQYAFDNGFGFAANYTYTQSTSALTTAFSNHLPIPGVAANALTGTVYYENYGFDARASYSWRSKAVNDGLGGATFSPTNTATGNPVAYGVFTAPYGELDAQVSYNFNDYISVQLSGQNLTAAAAHTYLQFPNMPFTYDNSGTRYFFGVRVKD